MRLAPSPFILRGRAAEAELTTTTTTLLVERLLRTAEVRGSITTVPSGPSALAIPMSAFGNVTWCYSATA